MNGFGISNSRSPDGSLNSIEPSERFAALAPSSCSSNAHVAAAALAGAALMTRSSLTRSLSTV
jgi:hypothetical protein